MDKRATKILLGCIACMLIVLVLFLIALRFSQLSCELIHVEPQLLTNSQLHKFNKNSPIRSEDKTLLMKISAYLEYDKLKSSSEDSSDFVNDENSSKRGSQPFLQPSGSWAPANISGPGQQRQTLAPSPSNPSATGGTNTSSSILGTQPGDSGAIPTQQLAKKRFLPLELESIETRHISEANKYKYILAFNCTKMHMVLVRTTDRVYIESMRLELKVSNKHKSECDVLLPASGAFAVGQQAAGHQGGTSPVADTAIGKAELVHYYCNKPLHYSCIHTINGDKSNLITNRHNAMQMAGGVHLAELHITGIEFETSLSLINGSGSEHKLKHVSKNEFSSKRKECNLPTNR